VSTRGAQGGGSGEPTASSPAPVAPGEVGALSTDLAAASLALARRFAAGATLWCCAPAWPQHGLHVAVEFVHPVIVGKRALPAVALTGPDPVAILRTESKADDVLLAVADAGDSVVRSAMARAPAWGLETIWIGAGPRPSPGAADHVLWLADDDGTATHTGAFVLLYHVLWELTHVCFEHPGLLTPNGPGEDDVCVTCRDEGRLAEVVSAQPPSGARVRTAAGLEDVDTTLVGDVGAGDLLLVHAGTAIGTVEAAP